MQDRFPNPFRYMYMHALTRQHEDAVVAHFVARVRQRVHVLRGRHVRTPAVVAQSRTPPSQAGALEHHVGQQPQLRVVPSIRHPPKKNEPQERMNKW